MYDESESLNINMSLYLKYKNKYLKLKKLQKLQKGGNPNKYTLYTFNIFNPSVYVTNMTFGNYYNYHYEPKESSKINNRIAEIDKKRFKLFRKDALLDIIDTWHKTDKQSIICLQEVNEEIKKILETKYHNNIKSTSGDTNIVIKNYGKGEHGKGAHGKGERGKGARGKGEHGKGEHGKGERGKGEHGNGTYIENIEKKEYRVTIIGENLVFTDNSEIVMHNQLAHKNGLYTRIQNIINKENIDICNIHIHYKSTAIDIKKYCDNMIEKIGDTKYIICGDFNKINTDPEFKIFTTNLKKINLKSIDYFTSNDFTAFDTKHSTEMKTALIDHIIIGNDINSSEIISPEILHKITTDSQTFDIFYELKRLSCIIDLKKSDDDILIDWLSLNKNFNISDHLPIKWVLNI